MTSYALSRLAPGSYDVLRDGVVIASLVRNGPSDNATWSAELLTDPVAGEMPAPFTDPIHEFRSLEEARGWLDLPATGPGSGSTKEDEG